MEQPGRPDLLLDAPHLCVSAGQSTYVHLHPSCFRTKASKSRVWILQTPPPPHHSSITASQFVSYIRTFSCVSSSQLISIVCRRCSLSSACFSPPSLVFPLICSLYSINLEPGSDLVPELRWRAAGSESFGPLVEVKSTLMVSCSSSHQGGSTSSF